MQKKLYEEPCIDIWDFEVSDIISESIPPVDGGEGGGGDPPIILM